MKIKTLSLILLLTIMVFSSTSDLFSKNYSRSGFTIEGYNYNVFYHQQKINSTALDKFHHYFKKSVYELSEKFNVKRPVSYRINLFIGAWLFRDMTGQDSHTAGIYIPENRSFYFQRPTALIKKNIIKETIKHELTHSFIHLQREKNNSLNLSKDLYWLEESFCVALYNNRGRSPFFKTKKKLKTIERFKNFLNKNLKSKNSKKRKSAYDHAGQWGNFLIKELGENKIFSLLTEKSFDKTIVDKVYIKFYNSNQ